MKKLKDIIFEKKLDKNLELGILVEMEHIHNFPDLPSDVVAKMIAIDHLKESKDYYIKLIDAGLVDEQPALDYYNDNFKKD